MTDAERFAHLPSGITLCFETIGDPADPPVLLIMGMGAPMHLWPDEFCRLLAERGYRVVRYDQRDTGRSTLVDRPVGRLDVVRAALGRPGAVAYRLSDLGDDAVGLLDHLGIEHAHVVGASMGGMVAQTIAIEHAARVASLTSIMSTSGARHVGWIDPRLVPMVLRPGATSRAEFVDDQVSASRRIGSIAYGADAEAVRAAARLTYDRGWTADGVTRHLLAVLAQPDRRRALREVTVPAMVIHGNEDRMVHPSGGASTARALPDAELLRIAGMGHDLPRPLYGAIVDAIDRTAGRV